MIQGYVYMLVCTVDNSFYIGSTTTTIQERFNTHISHCKTRNCMPYTHFREKGIQNLYINILEHVTCDTKNQLRIHENFYIRLHFQDKLCLNNNLAIITPEIKKEISHFYSILKLNKFCTMQNNSYVKQALRKIPLNILQKFPNFKIPENPPIKLWKEKFDIQNFSL